MDDTLSITTPENVELTYSLAGIGSRFIAVLIDSLIQGVIVAGVSLGAYILASLIADTARLQLDPQTFETLTYGYFAIVFLFLFALIWGYFILFEAIWNGQTPGKRVARLRVIKENGYPITLWEAIIRNLVRIVDFLPMAYSVGVVVMFVNRRWRRLGDFAAGTIVVKEGERIDLRTLAVGVPRGVPYRPSPTKIKAKTSAGEVGGQATSDRPLPAESEEAEIALPTVEVTLPNLDRLTPDDYSVIREYLSRRDQMQGDKSRDLGSRLAAAIATKIGYEMPPSTDGLGSLRAIGFLEQVLRESQSLRAAV